jgi:hypothetical protein
LYLEGKDLILERFPLDGSGGIERRIVARGIERLRLSYAAPADEEGLALVASWRGRSAFPALVVIAADSASGAPQWPPLAARPRLAARW